MTTTRSEINSNFYQIVTVDEDGLPVEVLPEYVANANVAYATDAGTANVANTATALNANIANVSISGGLDGYILQTNGSGTLSWTPQTGGGGGNVVPGGSNTQVQFNNNGSFGGISTTSYNGSTLILGENTDISILGGNTNSLLQTDGSGNLTWADSGNIITINLDGSSSNVLYGNGIFAPATGGGNVANANYANFAGTAYSVSGSNVTGQVANANLSYFSNVTAANNYTGRLAVVSGSGDSQIYRATNAVVTTLGSNVVLQLGDTYVSQSGFIGNGSGLTNLTGANVTGQVSFAATANSVAVANVSGIGNIATVNLTGSTTNVLYGNGTFAAVDFGNVANANYSNFAGTAYSVSAANISGTVNLANYATVANSVAVANVSGIGNIATVNLDGSTSNVLYGNGVFGAIPPVTSVEQANVANTANSVAGSNVSGEVANAAYATTAGSADSVDVANVSGIGNIATINLDGNVSNVLTGNGTFVALPTGGGNVFTDITVNNSILLDGITITNNANVFTAEIVFSGSNTNVATSTALVELINFSSNSIVQNDLGNVTLTTTGSDFSLSNTETKFGPYSWYNITPGNNNFFLTENISIGDLSTSTDYTIDMWVYVEGSAPTDENQTLFNGGQIDGSSDNSVTLYINSGNGLKFDPAIGAASPTDSTQTLNNNAWNHVGIQYTNSTYYFLINGVAEEFTPSASIVWPSTALRFLGAGYAYPLSFGRGYITNIRVSKTYALFPVTGANTYSLPVSTDYDPTGNVTIVTPGSTTNALNYAAIGNVPQNLYPNSNVSFNGITITGTGGGGGIASLSASGTVLSPGFAATNGGTTLQMNGGSGNDAVFSMAGSGAVLWINGGDGLKFPDGSVQSTAAGSLPSDITANTVTANIITANSNVSIANILLENNGSNILSITSTSTVPNVSNVATSTALTELFNFDTSTVQNDLGNVSLTTSGSDWSLSTSQLKYANYSWYNVNSSPSNYFETDYNFDPLNSSSNWTIDMWVYADSSGSGAGFQTFLNGSFYGLGPDNLWFGVDNSTPTDGTVCFFPDNSTRYNIGTMSGAGWYHVGLMKRSGILYGLFNGTITAVSGNPTVNFPNGNMQYLGGSNNNAFAIGYITNMRVSPDYALFSDDGAGSYTLPISTDYDPTGNIEINGATTVSVNAAPPAWSTITNDSANLANITGTVGSVVAVTDGGGKLAYWDTTNSRWSYVFDNSAV